MRLITKPIFYILSNAIALFVADRLISGFTLEGGVVKIFITAILLTAMNMLIRPILKLILSPLIILTLGTFTIAINALLLYILDIFSNPLIIQGFTSLLFSTLLISVVNLILHLVARPRR